MQIFKIKSKTSHSPFVIAFKMILIGYLMIQISGYLVVNTDAYYADQKQTSGSILLGTWESENKKQQTDTETTEKSERNRVVSDESKQGNLTETNKTGEEIEVETTTTTHLDDINKMTNVKEGEES